MGAEVVIAVVEVVEVVELAEILVEELVPDFVEEVTGTTTEVLVLETVLLLLGLEVVLEVVGTAGAVVVDVGGKHCE